MNSLNILRRALLLWMLIALASLSHGSRAIPDDNLSYPVLVTIGDKSNASGFYLRDGIHLYFVTARHVLFESNQDTLKSQYAVCLSYSEDPNDTNKNLLRFDLEAFNRNQQIRSHKAHDVSLVRIGNITKSESTDSKIKITWSEGVQRLEYTKSGIVVADIKTLRTYKQVLVANDVFVFGYPTSIGIKKSEQIDYIRPLLRKGIVAGKNRKSKTLILDCPIYPGNSGGPVVQVETISLTKKKFLIIGIVTDFIPFTEKWIITRQGHSNLEISNSGYSIAAPMDAVLDLLWKSEE